MQVLPDVAVMVTVEGYKHDPGEQTEAGQSSHKHHPEPDEQVDLLIEEIDGQNALHHVMLNVTQMSYLEVTHCDMRESS